MPVAKSFNLERVARLSLLAPGRHRDKEADKNTRGTISMRRLQLIFINLLTRSWLIPQLRVIILKPTR